MAPRSDSSILVPVFFDGTLPRYGFSRCVACALGFVVPSAGLIGRGVATEYPRASGVCPQAASPVPIKYVTIRSPNATCDLLREHRTISINLLQALMQIETDRSHIFFQHYIRMRPLWFLGAKEVRWV